MPFARKHVAAAKHTAASARRAVRRASWPVPSTQKPSSDRTEKKGSGVGADSADVLAGATTEKSAAARAIFGVLHARTTSYSSNGLAHDAMLASTVATTTAAVASHGALASHSLPIYPPSRNTPTIPGWNASACSVV